MKLRLLLFAAALLGAFPSPGYTPEEEALARELAADPGIRDRARGTPAEFMANQRGWMEDGARALLDGSASPERKARIVALYSRILRDIRRGLDWKEPRRQVEIPHLPQAPGIDGAIPPGEWAGALLFEGEYPLDGTRKLPGTATRWRVGWHGEMFCVAAESRKQAASRPSPPFPSASSSICSNMAGEIPFCSRYRVVSSSSPRFIKLL